MEQLYDHHPTSDFSEQNDIPRYVPHQKTYTLQPQKTAAFTAARRNTSVITLRSVDAKGESWKWWPSTEELRSHYMHDLGFLACLIMFISMSVFCIAGLTSLPAIYNALDTPAKLNGAYWAPQVVGGVGFVLCGAMFMIETQEHWWLPSPGVLGWHIGL